MHDIDDEQWLALVDSFSTAAIDGQGWYAALEGLAAATGSQYGGLIGLDGDASITFNFMTNTDPAWLAEFDALGGGDPQINPRVHAVLDSPILKVCADSDFTFPETTRRNSQHQEFEDFLSRTDSPHACLSPLERHQGELISLAVVRSQRAGHITNQQREVFTTLVPHVRAAVRTQIMLEGQGSALLVGIMDDLLIPAFICDRRGCVQVLTPTAELLVGGKSDLRLKSGALSVNEPDGNKALQEAMAAAASGVAAGKAPAQRTIALRSIGKVMPPLVLEVVSLPRRQFEFIFAPRFMVVVRSKRGLEERWAAVLHAVYGLTAAEVQVALLLVQGKSADAIAAYRRVAVGTVREQIKAILGKTGVQRQIEFLALVNRF